MPAEIDRTTDDNVAHEREILERYTQPDPDAPAPAQGHEPGVGALPPTLERAIIIDPGGNLVDRQGRLLPPAEAERVLQRLQAHYGAGIPGDAAGMPGGAATKSASPGMTATAIGELHRQAVRVAPVAQPAPASRSIHNPANPGAIGADVAHLAGRNQTGSEQTIPSRFTLGAKTQPADPKRKPRKSLRTTFSPTAGRTFS
jgi:hypothetical protein